MKMFTTKMWVICNYRFRKSATINKIPKSNLQLLTEELISYLLNIQHTADELWTNLSKQPSNRIKISLTSRFRIYIQKKSTIFMFILRTKDHNSEHTWILRSVLGTIAIFSHVWNMATNITFMHLNLWASCFKSD
jgi:hypothetical protein